MNNKNSIFSKAVAPGEKLSEEVLYTLKVANDTYTKDKSFPKYSENIQKIFQVKASNQTTERKLFLGGFMEGEASLNISAKKHDQARFGILLDPELSLTQHVNGVKNLLDAMDVFQTGRIRHKTGSNATLVFTISNRQSLEEKVIPFYDAYVTPYGSATKQERLRNFKQIIQHFNSGCHKDLNCFVNQMLPLWDAMRMQVGQKNQSFGSLESLEQGQSYARDFFTSASSSKNSKNQTATVFK